MLTLSVSHSSFGRSVLSCGRPRLSRAGGPDHRLRTRLGERIDRLDCIMQCLLNAVAGRLHVAAGELVGDEPVADSGSTWCMSRTALVGVHVAQARCEPGSARHMAKQVA